MMRGQAPQIFFPRTATDCLSAVVELLVLENLDQLWEQVLDLEYTQKYQKIACICKITPKVSGIEKKFLLSRGSEIYHPPGRPKNMAKLFYSPSNFRTQNFAQMWALYACIT